jgi:hypothetical protein
VPKVGGNGLCGTITVSYLIAFLNRLLRKDYRSDENVS